MISNNYSGIADFNRQSKINEIYKTDELRIHTKKEVNTIKKDTIEISKDTQFEIERQEKISKISESIKSGNYKVDSKRIAISMFQNIKTLE